MRIKVIACKVMQREMYLCAANSPNIIDIQWLKQALHNEPERLRAQLQQAIDETDNNTEETYDTIVLGYCLCSNGIIGLHSTRHPIVIARGHDCITMLLGSKERYKELFNTYNGGIYWYSPGWIEHSLQPGKERYEMIYKSYADKYGEENAQYLMDMEQNWFKEYKHALYIKTEWLDNTGYQAYTKECADYLGWQCHITDGNFRLIKDMFDGKWDNENILVIPPGRSVKPTHDDNIIDID